MDQCPELGSPTSEARTWHPAGAPRPCQPHSQVCGEFLVFWEVWGLLPAFSRCSVGVVPHVDVFLMYLWGGRWSPRLTLLPSWRSLRKPEFLTPFSLLLLEHHASSYLELHNFLFWSLSSLPAIFFILIQNTVESFNKFPPLVATCTSVWRYCFITSASYCPEQYSSGYHGCYLESEKTNMWHENICSG